MKITYNHGRQNTAIATLGILGAIITSLSLTPVLETAYAHSCEENGCIEQGKMTGGGRINTDIILTHGFRLNCDPSDGPNRLEINWDKGNRFHLESVTDINCFDDPAYNPARPAAAFDTLELSGFGRYNGESGAFVWVQLTDFGEPGKNDWATVVVYDGEGNLILDVTGHLQSGNHQAHK